MKKSYRIQPNRHNFMKCIYRRNFKPFHFWMQIVAQSLVLIKPESSSPYTMVLFYATARFLKKVGVNQNVIARRKNDLNK